MDRRAVFRILIAAPVAAVFGSVTGSLCWLIISELFKPPSPEPHFAESFAVVWVFVSALSLMGTVPGAFLVGAPVCYAIRRQLSVHPLSCAIPLVMAGALMGGFGGALFRSPGSLAVGTSYGALTAIAFAFWFALRRPFKRPVLSAE